MEEINGKLHAVMLPWLAMGHLFPCFQLSKRLAIKGLRISIFTTPGNIRRLPPVPPNLTPLLNFVPCPLPAIENLPNHIENTDELRSEAERPLLHRAYTQLEHGLTAFLADHLCPKPDWIIFDAISSYWIPPIAARFGLSCALFSIFNAAALSFLGPSPAYDSPEELTIVPDHIPFPTNVALQPFEARQLFPVLPRKSTPPYSRPEYFPQSDLLLIRTCREFEAKWLDLLTDMHRHRNPVIPVGVLPPFVEKDNEENSQVWVRIRQWLDKREDRSVVYVAFGTEVKLTREQIGEIGDGLERSGLAFIWVLRECSPPDGFEERNAGRGMVLNSWVPQSRLLAHPAVGGFLNQSGWSSVVEGLAFGVAMAVLPMVFDQGLNARNFVESGIAVEVPRNAEDGSFSGKDIATTLKMMMTEEEGEEVRARARASKKYFGCEKLQSDYMDELVKNLWKKRKSQNSK